MKEFSVRTRALAKLNVKACAVEADGRRLWSEVVLDPPLDTKAALALDALADMLLDGVDESGQRRKHDLGSGDDVLDDLW